MRTAATSSRAAQRLAPLSLPLSLPPDTLGRAYDDFAGAFVPLVVQQQQRPHPLLARLKAAAAGWVGWEGKWEDSFAAE